MPQNSTLKKPSTQKRTKPPKVGKKFPLWPHKSGRWCKKVGQKFYYFGRWDDPDADPADAEAKWDWQKNYLREGKLPPPMPSEVGEGEESSDKVTVKYLLDACLTAKEKKVESGELAQRTLNDYRIVWQKMADILGKSKLVDDLTSDDFGRLRSKIAKTRSLTSLDSFIVKCKVPFKWALKEGLIERTARFGTQFEKPSAKDLLKHRNKLPEKFFEPDELQALIEAATQPLKSMILLGVNVAFGNTDIGSVPASAFDLDAGIVEYPRPKTGLYRRAILWPETVESLREWMTMRPRAKLRSDSGLMFITKYGSPWTSDADNAVSKEFAKLCKSLKLNKKFRGFYSLRHTFRTIADEVTDTGAVAIVMGHALQGMAGTYVRRKRISNDRLQAVSDCVQDWLFGADGPSEGRLPSAP